MTGIRNSAPDADLAGHACLDPGSRRRSREEALSAQNPDSEAPRTTTEVRHE